MTNHARSERGATLVLYAFFLLFFILPMLALVFDLGSILWARRERQAVVDVACLDAAIAETAGWDPAQAAVAALERHGVPLSFHEPQEGSGVGLMRGVELGGTIRVAVRGPTISFFHRFLGSTGWSIGAQAHCEEGSGGLLPLALKEWECLGVPPECDWEWGDEVVLAGDGHWPNVSSGQDMSGLVSPDIRCQEDGCPWIWYIPPVAEGTPQNTVKDITMDYLRDGGYPGPLPAVGENVGQLSGVSNHQLVESILSRYGVGDIIIHFVYSYGEVFDAPQNYDYVEVAGYVVSRVTRTDANTLWVVPITEILDQDEVVEWLTHPILIPWREG